MSINYKEARKNEKAILKKKKELIKKAKYQFDTFSKR